MDDREREVIRKVGALVDKRYAGDYRKAFDHYDGDRDGKISVPECVNLLYDAEIGNRMTRWGWARGVIDALDRNADGNISWEEFEKHLT